MSFNWWSHLVFMFAGLAGGVILGVWVDNDTIFKGSVKIKQKGQGNVQSPEISPEIGRVKQWRLKRSKRKLDKLMEKM